MRLHSRIQDILSYVLFGIGIGVFILGVVFRIKYPVTKPVFLEISHASDSTPDKTIKKDYYREQRKTKVFSVLIAVVMIAAIIIVQFMLERYSYKNTNEVSYESTITRAFIENALGLSFVLNDTRGGEVSGDEKDEILMMIDATLSSFDEVESYPDVADDYQRISFDVESAVTDLRDTLQELQSYILNGVHGDEYNQLISKYNEQISEALELYESVIVIQTQNALYEMLGDD